MKKLIVAAALALSAAPVSALPLTFVLDSNDGQTAVFRAALGGIGLAEIGSVNVADSNSGSGGSPGVFSGFDLDFIFLDLDGNYATAGDRVHPTTLIFNTGTIRPTADPSFLPTAARPGPTFGSPAANVIDPALATLGTRDGSFPALFSTDNVFGWLTLGDGGALLAGFAAPIALTGSEALFVGEVGNASGEFVNASVTVDPNVIPLPSSLALLGLGLGLLGVGVACKQS